MTIVKGFHVLADLYNCPAKPLKKATTLRSILIKAAEKAGFNIVGESFHQFEPFGATGIILIANSHISAHTWPELGFVALDIYSCDGKEKAKKATEFLVKAFKPKRNKIKEVKRFR